MGKRMWVSLVAGAVVATATVAVIECVVAKPPRPRDRADRNPGEASTVSGTVRSLSTAPRGEVDGAVLDDGTVLHWPPHLQDAFQSVAKVGERVEATGRNEAGPAGDSHFEVQKLTNARSGESAQNDEVRPEPPAKRARREPRGRDDAAVTTLRGTIRRLTTAPRGEVDGAVLDSGSIIHWPPHEQDAFQSVAKVGNRIEATGRDELGPEGERRFEVERLISLANSDATESAGPDRPAEARRAAHAPGRDRDERLQALQDQLDQIQREIDHLRRER